MFLEVCKLNGIGFDKLKKWDPELPATDPNRRLAAVLDGAVKKVAPNYLGDTIRGGDA